MFPQHDRLRHTFEPQHSNELAVEHVEERIQGAVEREALGLGVLPYFPLANGLLTRLDLDLARKTAMANERSGKTEMTRRRLQYLKRK